MAKKKAVQVQVGPQTTTVYSDQVDGHVVVKINALGDRALDQYATSSFVWDYDFKKAWIVTELHRAVQIANEMKKAMMPQFHEQVKIARVVRTVKLEVLP